jgi:hypothetical protein
LGQIVIFKTAQFADTRLVFAFFCHEVDMKRITNYFLLTLLVLGTHSTVLATDTWTAEQLEVLSSVERMSAATAPGGSGADGYAAVLAEGYSRWTTGSKLINGKQDWVDGIRTWFDEGWRVTDRDQHVVEISVKDEYAFTRRIVEETYLGPTGESTVSKAALAETWVRDEGAWLLFRVHISVLDSQ